MEFHFDLHINFTFFTSPVFLDFTKVQKADQNTFNHYVSTMCNEGHFHNNIS